MNSAQNLFEATLVAEVKAIDATIASLQEKRKHRIAALLGCANETTGKRVTAEGSYTISENNTYSESAMVAALRPGQMRLVQKKVIDRSKVKALYPKVYEESKKRNGFKVTIG